LANAGLQADSSLIAGVANGGGVGAMHVLAPVPVGQTAAALGLAVALYQGQVLADEEERKDRRSCLPAISRGRAR
jgi:hypothetical protein